MAICLATWASWQGSIGNWACLPLSIRLHNGLQAAKEWKNAVASDASHVVQMIGDAYRAACAFGDSLLLLDRYFLTVPALQKLDSLNKGRDIKLEIVTKAKRSCVILEKPDPKKPGRGRPPKKGASVHLKELFTSRAGEFKEAELVLYGKKKVIRYYSINLLWGDKTLQGTAVCADGDGWHPEHPDKHQPGIVPADHYPAL